jgi:hypothetical protein
LATLSIFSWPLTEYYHFRLYHLRDQKKPRLHLISKGTVDNKQARSITFYHQKGCESVDSKREVSAVKDDKGVVELTLDKKKFHWWQEEEKKDVMEIDGTFECATFDKNGNISFKKFQ